MALSKKIRMPEDEILRELAAVVDAFDARYSWGWPGEEIARIAFRRWTSFPLRNKSKAPTSAHRVNDLVKGLCAHFEPDVQFTPTLDWRDLAEKLAAVLEKLD